MQAQISLRKFPKVQESFLYRNTGFSDEIEITGVYSL